MNLDAFYAVLGVDYSGVLRRLGTQERVLKFVRRVKDDRTMDTLHAAMAGRDAQEAFRAAHTLKGIALNLDLLPLSESAVALTDLLRGAASDWAQAQDAYEQVCQAYQTVMEAIEQLDG